MEDPEIITGDKISLLMDQLRQEHTILKLYMPGIGNDWLSIVVGIKKENGTPCFVIDSPSGAGFYLHGSKGQKIIIEFTDRNHVHYRLRSVIERVADQNVYVMMPEFVYRLQRRGYFRVPSPVDTKISVSDQDGRLSLEVVNISESGVLASNPSASHTGVRFFKGAVKGLVIIYKEDEGEQIIRIKKAEIRRVVKRPDTGCYEYAFMFLDRGKDIEKEIRMFIYSCQRKMLYRQKYEDENQD
jgi:c-di-GMP-binding flagellar brake protein YcgR